MKQFRKDIIKEYLFFTVITFFFGWEFGLMAQIVLLPTHLINCIDEDSFFNKRLSEVLSRK